MTVVGESAYALDRRASERSAHAPAGDGLPAGRWHGGLWVSDRPLDRPEQYGRCVAEFERTGLWPLLIPHDDRFAATGEDWLADRGWLWPDLPGVDELSAARALQRWWPGAAESARLWPYGADFPGPARPVRSRADRIANAGNMGILLATKGQYRLALAPVDRPADVPAALGWAGAISATEDVAALSAVLRSWEERFSAVLVVLGFDAMELAVAASPRAAAHALAVAAEHTAFCPRADGTTLPKLAESVLRQRTWRFCWN